MSAPIMDMFCAAERARRASTKGREVVIYVTELGFVVAGKSTRRGQALAKSEELAWPEFEGNPTLLANSVSLVDAALLRAEHDGMTENEMRRFDSGREDWRETDWQDHCDEPGCPECDKGPTVL